MKIFEGHTSTVNCLIANKKGDRLFSGSDDKTIRMWDTKVISSNNSNSNNNNKHITVDIISNL